MIIFIKMLPHTIISIYFDGKRVLYEIWLIFQMLQTRTSEYIWYMQYDIKYIVECFMFL